MRPIPPGLSFKEALQNGYVVFKVEKYLAAVRQLPCSICAAPPPSDPHHPHGVGYRGAGTKCPDIWVFPLCREHHDELHRDRVEWEEKYGSQFEFVALTVAHLWLRGDVTLGSH